MASTKPAFILDRQIWNSKLYSDMQKFWFDGLSRDAIAAPQETMQKWWGFGKTDEEKQSFDEACRTEFAHAIESISPSQIGSHLPTFKSYQDDLQNHLTSLSSPFLQTVVPETDPEYPWQLLSIILLLDQIPRNIYRTAETLPLVYNHYDRLTFSLLHTVVQPKLYGHAAYKSKPPFYVWLIVPCEHAEHMPTLEMGHEAYDQMKRDLETDAGREEGYAGAVKQLEGADTALAKHLEPMRRFGRYPHRNHGLGRRSTAGEEEFLRGADTFGVKVQK